MFWYKQSTFQYNETKTYGNLYVQQNLNCYLYLNETIITNMCISRFLNKLMFLFMLSTRKLLISLFHLTLSSMQNAFDPAFARLTRLAVAFTMENQWRRIYNTINHSAAISLSNVTQGALKTWIATLNKAGNFECISRRSGIEAIG